MVDIRLDRFRLTNITNIASGTMPESEGLALEVEADARGHFYVIAFIYWDAAEDSTYITTVGTRFEDELELQDFKLVRELFKAGSAIIRAVNTKNMEE